MRSARNGIHTCTWVVVVMWATGAASAGEATEAIGFQRSIQPLLKAHCMKCHGLEAREAGLDLRTVALIRRGGKSGPAIQSDAPLRSRLWNKVVGRSMPPKGELPLTDNQIGLIKRWLESGDLNPGITEGEPAEVDDDDRAHWAFQASRRPRIPYVRQSHLANHAVDQFLLAKLEAKSLSFSKKAPRSTLVRRAFLDLVGLPPSPAAVAKFLNDSSPLAYDRLVDRLLSSPHFGQRWGRHWLDVAGYVDTIGDDTDATIAKVASGKWRYRDYVVNSFNADKPFDRFAVEQLAGDELFDWRSMERLTPEIRNLLIATTFLRSAADETLQNELNTADIRHEVLQRTMEVTVNNLLGLTIQCARCHSHKYDPLPQEDYYRLLACFTPAFDPQAWLQPAKRELPDISPQQRVRLTKHNAEIDKQVAERNRQVQMLRQSYRERLFAGKLAAVPADVRSDAKRAIQTPKAKRSPAQAKLVAKFGASLAVSDADIDKSLTDVDRAQQDALRREVNQFNARRKGWGTIQAVYDIGPAPATYLLSRGNHERPSYEVKVAFPRVLNAGRAVPLRIAPTQHSSGRRLALANWITDPNHAAAALMARVVVNRIWQKCFGRGIVTTPANFGMAGAAPTHPELLEWLVAEFMASGWSQKHVVKLIVTSRGYQQTSTEPHTPQADPGNFLLWKMPLRQLESEIVRDSILTASGQLKRTFGGPPVLTTAREDGFVVVDPGRLRAPHEQHRRSLYILARRRYHESFLEAFGQPELTTNCSQRIPAAVVGQSLSLMNDTFLFEQSARFADRVIAETPEKVQHAPIETAFMFAFARRPTKVESNWAQQFLDEQTKRYRQQPKTASDANQRALRHLCHMLLCSNEFLYVP